MLRTAILVLSWNAAPDLATCLTSLRGQGADTILVVDNGSADASCAVVERGFPWARLIRNERNLGFGGGMNVGLRALLDDHDVIVLLNQDTVVAPGWLPAIVRPFAEPQVGAVGCKIYYPDGKTVQHAGGSIEPGRLMGRHFGHHQPDGPQYDQPRDCEYLTGAALALRSSALREVGLFDEGYSPAYYEDVDLCWRLRRAGYTLRYAPDAQLQHGESQSSPDVLPRASLMHRNRLRFAVKTATMAELESLLLAEQVRLATIGHCLERRTLGRAYLAGILAVDEWINARREFYAVSANDEQRIRALCTTLRREMVELQ